MIAVTIKQVYYRIFITIVLYLLDLWVCSVTISTVYTKFHEIYVFDLKVSNLLNYLKLNGLCEALLEAVIKYTRQLWKRQKGMPSIFLIVVILFLTEPNNHTPGDDVAILDRVTFYHITTRW